MTTAPTDLVEVLRTTGAVRAFQDRAVDRAVVARVLDNARFAPNGGNQQAWRVVLVENPARRRALRDLYLAGWAEYLEQRTDGVQPWAPIGDRAAEASAVQRARPKAPGSRRRRQSRLGAKAPARPRAQGNVGLGHRRSSAAPGVGARRVAEDEFARGGEVSFWGGGDGERQRRTATRRAHGRRWVASLRSAAGPSGPTSTPTAQGHRLTADGFAIGTIAPRTALVGPDGLDAVAAGLPVGPQLFEGLGGYVGHHVPGRSLDTFEGDYRVGGRVLARSRDR